MKLVILDPSESLTERFRAAFSHIPGLDTQFARSVEEGCASLKEAAAQVVILDVQIRHHSGLDVINTIKRKYPGTVVLVYSDHLLYRKRCVAEGADRFFDKPMEFDALVEIVKNIIGRRHDGQANIAA